MAGFECSPYYALNAYVYEFNDEEEWYVCEEPEVLWSYIYLAIHDTGSWRAEFWSDDGTLDNTVSIPNIGMTHDQVTKFVDGVIKGLRPGITYSVWFESHDWIYEEVEEHFVRTQRKKWVRKEHLLYRKK